MKVIRTEAVDKIVNEATSAFAYKAPEQINSYWKGYMDCWTKLHADLAAAIDKEWFDATMGVRQDGITIRPLTPEQQERRRKLLEDPIEPPKAPPAPRDPNAPVPWGRGVDIRKIPRVKDGE